MNDILSIIKIAREAGDIIMRYYKGAVDFKVKDDNSPVTEADIKANDFIVQKLKALHHQIPIIAEENERGHNESHDYEQLKKGRFFLVDLLDGTKGFIRKDGQFTVNIGLVENRKPVMGVVLIPAEDRIYYSDGKKSFRIIGNGNPENISVKEPSPDGVDVIVSFSHNHPKTDEFLSKYKIRNRVSASSSIKFCRVAEGVADVYPRLGRTMEWDTAAGHAVLNTAGGSVTTLEGGDFLYGKDGFENPGFVAFSNFIS